MKEKINKLDSNKIKTSVHQKSKMLKREITEQEKIFVTRVTEKITVGSTFVNQ